MSKPRILVFGGSLRLESYNQKLAALAAESAHQAGAEVTLISLRDYRLPLFDEDDEEAEGKPEGAKKLKELFVRSDGFIIASPEYNSGITGVLKNTIDWVSRADSDDEPPLLAFKGKAAAIIAASPGGYGGARSLAQLRILLGNIRVEVIDGEVTIPKAYEAFTADDRLTDGAQMAAVEQLVGRLVDQLRKTEA
ncbi:NAD(P)H-dependent oxidoreductase [Luteolibacter sp. SL250]|uniref:NADPH-dependent FMN reductase n=1 Tax=Luteolibacter sp. SL250 TaxID=2995170 RepID=UPI002270A571|nr:NAD(P)H-dependent oxidoreductase [Luteolibacter sp. SL250]WAC21226.1 NAD(P)H-dependent oxidoreductase [Luteolibacter sp. SL250]